MARLAPSPAAIAVLLLTLGGIALVAVSQGYTQFIIALVALTTVVSIGLNVLLGLSGQVSLGHVGFYAIGAYVSAILTLKGINFWIALPIAGVVAGVLGALLALPALRATGPYLAMITIAFAFIVQHVTIEWKDVTGGQNGLMGITPPSIGRHVFSERELAMTAIVLAGASLLLFLRLAASGWGKAMVAVRDSEIAACSIGLNPTAVKTAAFACSAVLTGLAGALFAPLMLFVAPDSFPFSQSILFLLAVIVGGAGWLFGPVVGALVTVLLPELLSGLAEYRLLFVGCLLLVVLWIAPEGVIGTFARYLPRRNDKSADQKVANIASALRRSDGAPLSVEKLGIAFGGVKAVEDVSFTAVPGRVTAVIGPNGAGKTTILNMIGGFYRPDAGCVRVGDTELAGASAWRASRAGIARTYQTTQLFGTMSVLDNVLIALRNGELGNPFGDVAQIDERQFAQALLTFVGYRGELNVLASDLPHVDRRLVEIARALATRPRVLLLDEPAAGLMRSDKALLGKLIREIAALGVAVILVEHDMPLVMGASDHIVVLDAGKVIAIGEPAEIRVNPLVLKAYLGGGEIQAKRRQVPWQGSEDAVLDCLKLTAGYGAAPVLQELSLFVRKGEFVTLLGANGAGKSTTMRAIAGLLRPVSGAIVLNNKPIEAFPAHRIAKAGLALVPEGRQVFPELSVVDNIMLGSFTRTNIQRPAELEAMFTLFPRLRERQHSRAGLLSGGEQQMLAIARGLMAKPQILLLDEPSLGLSPVMMNELYGVLARLRDDGVTILLVDQMATAALSIADRGYLLELGRVVVTDGAAKLIADPALKDAYLGTAAIR